MDENLNMQISLFIFISFLVGISFLFEAYKIRIQNGVVSESKWFYIIMVFVSFIQFLTLDHTGIDPILWYCLLVVAILSVFFKLYSGGRNIKIMDATEQEVLHLLEEELTNLAIPYEKNDGMNSEEFIYDLVEDSAKIKITTGMLGDVYKDYHLSFKKSWRSPRLEELQYRLLEKYRQQGEEKIFGKQILIQCILGFVFIIGAVFFHFSK